MPLGLGLSMMFRRRSLLSSEGALYVLAANELGYSGGSSSCADEFFNTLIAVETPGFAQASAYISAATADSFTGGSVYCSELSFAELENVEEVFF